MIKKRISVLLFLVFITFSYLLLPQKIFAQSLNLPQRESAQNEIVFGQHHFYTVVFRGNGEAIVYAKLAITNSEDFPLDRVSFEIPKVAPTELVMYQMKLPQRCTDYQYDRVTGAKTCTQYTDPDYTQSYYYYGDEGKAEYTKISYSQSGNTYSLSLPNTVQPYKSTAVIIAYTAKGYVQEKIGLFTFNFETLKVPSRIQELKVAVNVDSNLILKGKKSSVNYSNSFSAPGTVTKELAFSAPSLDNVVRDIGSRGSLVKEAKNLSPNESFTVKGEYSTSWIRLYIGSIITVIIFITIIFAALYFLSKKLNKRKKENPPVENATSLEMPAQTKNNQLNNPILMNVGAGFISALSFVVTLYAFFYISTNDIVPYIPLGPLTGAVIFISILLLFVIVIFGPAIYIASKSGWKALVYVLISEFLWFLLFTIISIVFFNSGQTGYGGGGILL